jgi:nitroimidazol reductase NimA-like FMN-containing flavoprotein (pyridoxamine 5'-phosphate oxidase superfamily)
MASSSTAPRAAHPTTAQVWRAIERANSAVLGFVTPRGEPRTSLIMHGVADRTLYVSVGRTSWKAKYVAANPHVSVTVLVRRGGPLALVAPIPPASVTFHGTADVLDGDDPAVAPLVEHAGLHLPAGAAAASALLRIRPEGEFLCYGIGVSLATMRDTTASRAHVPVDDAGSAG